MMENVTYDEIQVGHTASFSKTLTEQDLILFATTSGDVNPAHLDEEYARNSQFGERIGHGMWSASLISAALATVLPGPGTVYLGQTLSFRRPVKIGDRLTANLEVVGKQDDKKQVILECKVVNQDGKIVVSGEATVIAPTEKMRMEKAPRLPKVSIPGL